MHGTFNRLKYQSFEESVAKSNSFHSSGIEFKVIPVGPWILNNNLLIDQIAELRNLNSECYFYSDSVSRQSTQDYFKDIVLPDPSRIWFLILDSNSNFLGHFGYSDFKPQYQTAMLDSVAKSRNTKIKMKDVLENSFLGFIAAQNVRILSLEVLSLNTSAIDLYESLGFKKDLASGFTRRGKSGLRMSLAMFDD